MVEDALEALWSLIAFASCCVSILVVVEDALEDTILEALQLIQPVSILVVVEDALEEHQRNSEKDSN